ncbi:MAG: DUF3783 domain-containing protein [Lachnospiraceae bacterium]
MEKLICYQIENTREIERLASNMKLRIVYADASLYDETLDAIASGKVQSTATVATGSNEIARTDNLNLSPDSGDSILIFCDLSEKHLNRMLFELKSRKVQIDLKAVLTPTNQKWTLRQLHAELEREKANFTRP